jgi:hypothetical protein
MSSGSTASTQIRLLLVEDVPQVAQYVRGLLNAQSAIKLIEVMSDGSKAGAQARSCGRTSSSSTPCSRVGSAGSSSSSSSPRPTRASRSSS